MSGRLFDPSSDQPLQPRAIIPQMDTRSAGAGAAALGATIGREFAEMEEQRRRVADGEARSGARSNYLMGMARLREELRGVAPEEMEARWEAGRRRLQEEHSQGLPERLRADFRATANAVDAGEFGYMVEQRGRRQQDRSIAALTTEIDGLRRQAASSSGEERARIISAMEAAIGDRIGTGAITEAAGARLRIQVLSQVDEDRALALMNTSPGEALRALQGGQFPNLNPETRERMVNSAMARIATLEARAEAATARRERAVAVEIGAIDNMMLAGFVPEPRLAALRNAARGTAHEGRVATLERDAQEVGRWAALPAAQQGERLTQMQADLQAGRGTPETFAQFQRLARVTQQQQTDIRQHGLERAVRDGIVPAMPALDFANPETLNVRVAAAQAASAHYGRAVSPFTTEDVRGLVSRFAQGSTDDALGITRGIAAIEDPTIRAEATRAVERARGDAGRMPAGALARVLEMERGGDVRAQVTARRVVDGLRADVSAAVERQGARPELQAALVEAQSGQIQGVRVRQAALGGGEWGELVARDMEVIRRLAMVRMAAGEEPAAAVRHAQADWNHGLATLDDRSLAHVAFPAGRLTAADAERGLRALRERAVPAVDPAMGQDAALQARRRAEATQRGVWINAGNGFALVSVGTDAPTVLARATLDEVRSAADGVAARDAERPPVMRREDTLERTRREQRQQPPAPERPRPGIRRQGEQPVMR